MKRIAILGSTGSVGTQALQIIADRPDAFSVCGLSAWRSAATLLEQTLRFNPAAICLAGANGQESKCPPTTAWFEGADGILEMLDRARPDLVLNGITGAAGLRASEWSLRNRVPLALANKESLVMAGDYLMALSREGQTPILPVDSEHCAIFQCVHGEDLRKVRRILLTGSGGPFRERSLDTFGDITPDEALRHPTWDMGPRITIGSATMMNKAFEILEAHWLFDLGEEQIQVLIHPQSIVHSMVEFVDGSILAQLGVPDMRIPILYCLGYPERMPFAFEPFDPIRFRNLTFDTVEVERYPAIPLAYEALRAKGDSGAVLNAADEVMTGLFLEGKISFPSITGTVAAVLRGHEPGSISCLDDVHDADRRARSAALEAIDSRPDDG